MFFSKTALPLAGLVASVVAAPGVSPANSLERRDDYCPEGYAAVNVLVSTTEVAYPVVINQFFGDNTIIIINGGVTININNAPTTLSTTVTATSTVTSTVTQGVGAVATPFILAVAPAVLRKRQSGSYVNAGGDLTSDCSSAAVFTLADGVLSSNGGEVSTDSGVANQIFAASQVTGDITQSFSAPANVLEWDNGNFTNGAASFVLLNGFVTVVFDGTLPAGSTPLVLSVVPASLCPVSSSTTSSAVPTATPTGASTFNIALNAPAGVAKRDIEYVTVQGGLTADRTLAAFFSIVDDELVSGGLFYGVDSADGTFAFTPSATPNIYSKTFSNNGGLLDFTNDAFNFAVSFCVLNGDVQISLSDKPTDCVTVELGIVPTDETAPTSISGSFTSTATNAVSTDSVITTTATNGGATTTETFTNPTFTPTSSFTSFGNGTAQATPAVRRRF